MPTSRRYAPAVAVTGDKMSIVAANIRLGGGSGSFLRAVFEPA
jgi:hypothetical protein